MIVVDDGSTDDTKKIAESFDKVKYIYQDNSGGAARPKNAGIKLAQGEYIAILDDDDEWLPEKLEKQVAYLDKNKDIDVVGCNYLIDGKKEYQIPKYKDVLKRILVTDDMGPGSIMMYRKKVFDELELFDENLKSGQDKEMRIKLASQGYKFGFVREPLVIYHTNHKNISVSLDINEREKDWNYLYNKYKKYYTKELYKEKLRYDGTRYMLLGYPKKARKCFLRAKKYCLYFLSLFGVNFYQFLTKIKLWLK